MSSGRTRRRRAWLYAALAGLYLLHNDLFLWDDPRSVLGLPAGLLYHLGYCLAASALMAALVRWAWPLRGDGGPLDRDHGGG